MGTSGQMSLRLANSYREDDRRRNVDRRRRQSTTSASTPATFSEGRSVTNLPSIRAAIGRLLPRLA